LAGVAAKKSGGWGSEPEQREALRHAFSSPIQMQRFDRRERLPLAQHVDYLDCVQRHRARHGAVA
jgi:hypothetical protein